MLCGNQSRNAVIPGMATEGYRSVWQSGQTTVLDGNVVSFLRQACIIPNGSAASLCQPDRLRHVELVPRRDHGRATFR